MNRQIGQIVTADPKAIWTDDEVGSDGDDDEFDTRRRPKYTAEKTLYLTCLNHGERRHEVLFKQEVMTEDVFLGLGDKDPSVASCDAMTIKISFPGHRLDEIALDLTKHKLIAQSHALKLSLYLPNPVRHKQGKATWDATTDTLAVTLSDADDQSTAHLKSTGLPLTRDSIADAVEKAAPGVVNITIFAHHQPVSSGSGFIIEPTGLIVTNAHVVANLGRYSAITVTLENGQKYTAKVHSTDAKSDLALVQIDGTIPSAISTTYVTAWSAEPVTKLPTVAIGSSSSLRAGEWVIALGSPLSLQNSVSAGIISATARLSSELGFSPSNRAEFIQTDAAINVGNSGGPLTAIRQRWNLTTFLRASGVSGISFAIPIDGGMEVIDQLRKHRTVARPYVGMQMVQFTRTVLPEIAKLYPTLSQGVVVRSVARGSPAEAAGILPGATIAIRRHDGRIIIMHGGTGDVIIEFAGSKVASIKDVLSALGFNVGRKMCMKVLRDGKGDPHTVCFVTKDASTC
ncbi:hypothetical protein DYB32_000992 [Aphanomyces invadans]|uniref:Uncharacterized protein n=1 Tax=Aphanomyces invadans TaxID=157072 RepID=A0A418B871_9STRA|nr:hypothetical protein DYB32_000992 [Aphanomyces invadans]